jgi:hypothetical protein
MVSDSPEEVCELVVRASREQRWRSAQEESAREVTRQVMRSGAPDGK